MSQMNEAAAAVSAVVTHEITEAGLRQGNNEQEAANIGEALFVTTLARGLAAVTAGVVDIRKAGALAIEHAMEHKQPTLLNKWLEGIAEAKALKVAGPQAWVAKYCPYTVSGTTCTYDPTGNHLLDMDAAKMENPFEMGKVEKPIDEFTASELLDALRSTIKRFDEGSKTKAPLNDDAKNMVAKAKAAISPLH